jgi:hypothetical protein
VQLLDNPVMERRLAGLHSVMSVFFLGAAPASGWPPGGRRPECVAALAFLVTVIAGLVPTALVVRGSLRAARARVEGARWARALREQRAAARAARGRAAAAADADGGEGEGVPAAAPSAADRAAVAVADALWPPGMPADAAATAGCGAAALAWLAATWATARLLAA